MSGAPDMVEGLGVERAWLQRVFDRGFRGLRSQGFKKSVRGTAAAGGSVCAYRQDHTASCAVRCFAGHLIPDERYHDGLEGHAVSDGFELDVFAEDVRPTTGEQVEVLAQLQTIHDQADFGPDAMEAEYRDLAAEHGLTVPQ